MDKTAHHVVQLARAKERWTSLDFFEEIFDSFKECHGDRLFADDEAIVGGIAQLDGKPVTVIGIQKDGICRKISAEILVLPILKAIEKLYD